ncbi:hypothetical protein PENANT_c009G08931 [Penicillium antarcticum]|uniref:DNA-directed RNA polymerase I subunit RPA34.5 n=1 Tax=Penicillium antarcticum TaxID=416450 RepID=A0A1V6Q9C7_9EURO|nr:uncharacterized protein N7508_008925 [Penicillium antarcticum]KAJ5294104.1 hypothetical protein N7508_008925 [Penicillium antarcticum]OQD85841.1 hypothetical protein PENANT_c009G08931 [Penicillium antarcticum]
MASDSDSSSSRSTSPEPTTKQEKNMKKLSKAQESSSDESSSSSGSDSDSDSDSSSEMKPTTSGKKVSISGPQPYKPPAGFKSAKTQAPPSSKTSSLLSNLSGKQIIHLTAPASLPLSKVKEVTMSKVMQGEPILSHDGVSYGIPTESFSEAGLPNKSLLVFDEKSQTYRTAAASIPSFHVQELIDLPSSEKTDAAVAALREYVKPARPQPKHLKMRFRPVGTDAAGPETFGSSSESEAEVPSFKVPKGEERKRKHDHTEADPDAPQAAAVPRKKSKKHSRENDDETRPKKSKKSSKDKEEKKRKKSEKA